MRIEDLDTPVAVVDIDRLERNIARFQSYLDAHDIANRPHIKTHKIPAIAHMQMRAGAVGISCQKLGEVEVMSNAGITDIFVPYNIMGEAKLERLAHLARRATISLAADSAHTVQGLSRMAQRHGMEFKVLVECDIGAKRAGMETPAEAAALARVIHDLPGVRFGGLMMYPFNERVDDFVMSTRALLDPDAIPIETVSAGGTRPMWSAHTQRTVTEYRAGMYIYGDRAVLASGAMTLDDIAFTVICTVVSRPTPDRGILDGGSKTFSYDVLGLDGHGLILEYPEAKIYGFSEEHGHTDFSACAKKPEIGERVTVVPNHCCVVSNLFNEVVGVRKGEVEVVWPVAARGLLK